MSRMIQSAAVAVMSAGSIVSGGWLCVRLFTHTLNGTLADRIFTAWAAVACVAFGSLLGAACASLSAAPRR